MLLSTFKLYESYYYNLGIRSNKINQGQLRLKVTVQIYNQNMLKAEVQLGKRVKGIKDYHGWTNEQNEL